MSTPPSAPSAEQTITTQWNTEHVERIARSVLAKCDAIALEEGDALVVDIHTAASLAAFVLDALSSLSSRSAEDRSDTDDTARLDWLQERVDGTGETLSMGGVCYWAIDIQKGGPRSRITRLGKGEDLRDAIDAARTASPRERAMSDSWVSDEEFDAVADRASAAGSERETENVISGLRARIGEAYANGNRRALGEHLDALCALAGSQNALVTAGWRQLLARLAPERGGEEETKR